ncbi:MAG: methionine--tRNA ligase [Clostridia bacterium]|nr:methionine--tRNA ligase [Clostridia bacterium]
MDIKKRNIVIGGAWPYANSSLHLGHVAGLISGDILARYFRLRGDNVIYTSGSDCHGTPITERARKEKKNPREIAEYYDREFNELFDRFNFSYDLFSKTDSEYHKEKVKQLVRRLYDNGYIYEKIEPQTYCENCQRFLSDREIILKCPECGEETKGDQCDNCLHVPTTEELLKGNCIECGSKAVKKDNKILYLALSKFQKKIEERTEECKHLWRINAKNETEKYLKQGLVDRAITRDLDWGVEVPVEGYEDKRLYVWIDAVLGYLTNTMKICEEKGMNWEDFWKEGHNNKIYMCHGKDNIMFHSIILNALLLGQEDNYHLVDVIVSAEYLNYNNQKFSKSKGIGITGLEALDLYPVDSLRYHLVSNGPEKKDTNFSPEDFVNTHNGEILNKFGNLVNRTLRFKNLDKIELSKIDNRMKLKIEKIYDEVGNLIENLEFREATRKIMSLVEDANKYYDEREPWKQRKDDIEGFNETIFTCANIIANLSNLFEPIMPDTTKKIREYLKLEKAEWKPVILEKEIELSNIEPLFERIKLEEK